MRKPTGPNEDGGTLTLQSPKSEAARLGARAHAQSAGKTTHNAITALQVLIKSRSLSAECLLGLTALSAECTQVRKICRALSAECTPEL